MFELFSDGARRVVVLAQEESHELDSGYIGSEHLLLGLLAHGVAVDGVTLPRLLAQVGGGQSHPRSHSGHIPFTDSAKAVLEGSLAVMRGLGQRQIEPGHLLAALCQDSGEGHQALVALGVDPQVVRQSATAALVASAEVEISAADHGMTVAAALLRYGRHDDGCPQRSCRCGLSAVLDLARRLAP